MKKFTDLFADSAREFKNIRTIAVCGVLAALAFVLDSFSVQVTQSIKIGFSGIPNEMVDFLFGPVAGSIFSGMMDILKLIVHPTGGWIPGLTLNAFLAGLIYGIFLYKKPIKLWRILTAKLIVAMVLNVALGSLWLSMAGIKVIVSARFVKNLIMWPINSLILYMLLKVFDAAGVFRMIGKVVPKAKKKAVQEN